MITNTVNTQEIAAEAILEGTGANVIQLRMMSNGCLVTEDEWKQLCASGSQNEK